MAIIYTHDGRFGAPAIGTRDEFRAALSNVWADWHQDADTDLSLEEYIEQSLDEVLTEADTWDLENVERLPAVAQHA